MSDSDAMLFDCGLRVKKLLYPSNLPSEIPSESTDNKGVKLPKFDVPTFDGNLINWQSFWEQFCVAVHDRPNLSNSEKLVYLRSSLKDSSAKGVIEGLSRSGEHYDEAIRCLQTRYNCPHLIHQTQVKKIIDIPPLKEGSGKELCSFTMLLNSIFERSRQ